MRLRKATGDTVLIQEIKPERKSAGGIVIPQTAQDKNARYGIVKAVGPRVEDPEIDVGELVVFSRFHAKTRVDGTELNICSEGDIYAIVDAEPGEHA